LAQAFDVPVEVVLVEDLIQPISGLHDDVSEGTHVEIALGRDGPDGWHAGFVSVARIDTNDVWRLEEGAHRDCD